MSKRNPGTLGVWGPNGTRVVAAESYWRLPVKWDRAATCNCGAAGTGGVQCEWCKAGCPRPRVFCASLADVFEDWHGPMDDVRGRTLYRDGNDWHSEGPPSGRLTMDHVRARLFRLIHETPNLDWLLLTKRPENVARCLARYGEQIDTYAAEAFSLIWNRRVWLGTSVENQQAADERIPHLLRVPAAVRFLSMEPLLGPVELPQFRCRNHPCVTSEMLRRPNCFGFTCQRCFGRGTEPGVDWIIAGGESGPNARPMHPDWVRSIRDQCQAVGVPFHFKQWGEYAPLDAGGNFSVGDKKAYALDELGRLNKPTGGITLNVRRVGKKDAGRLLDGRTWDEVPELTTAQ